VGVLRNLKKGATLIKLNAITNLNVWVILMSHCGRDRNADYIHITG
jgi:hypothetical protein